MFKDFKEFVMRGNVVDMAVGIIIGVAFGAIVQSLVKDVIMPPIGLLLGKVDVSNIFLVLKASDASAHYSSLKAAQDAGAVTMNFGLFVNTIINFVILAFAIFIVVKGVNQLRRPKPAPANGSIAKTMPFLTTVLSW
jgi:large conductance mechanosensitive channel